MTVGVERLRTQVRRPLTIDVQRFLLAFMLAGYGIFIVSLFLRNVMIWYINPSYVAPTTIAGGALIGLAVIQLRRPARNHGESCDCEEDCCSPSQTKLWTYGLLAVPLILAAIFPPRSLADFSALQRGPQIAGLTTIRGATAVKRVSLSVNTRTFGLQDWAGALAADPNPADYKGKPVVITGLVLHDSASVPPGYIMVLRYQVTCCIADARPVGLVVRDISHGSLQDNQWVKVTGSMGAANYEGQSIAVVDPTQLTPTIAGNPYMY